MGALLEFSEPCPAALDFPVHTLWIKEAIFLEDFGTFSAEMEMPFPLRISLIIEFIIELNVKVQISCPSHAKYTGYAFRTV